MPQLSEIHEELSKPTLLDKLRNHTSREAGQLLDKGKTMYVAKKTFDTLPSDAQSALPKPLQEKFASAVFVSMLNRMAKQASILDAARTAVPKAMGALRTLPGAAKTIATGATDVGLHRNEVAGLGVLAVPGLDTLQASARARLAGDKGPEAVEKRHLLGQGAHAALDVGGLGLLAGPAAAKLKHAFAQSNYGGNVAQNPPGMRGRSQLPAFTAPEIAVRKTAGVEEMLFKKMRADGKSSAEADRLIGEGKTAFDYEATRRYIYAHFVGTPEKTAGALSRASELMTGSRAKKLTNAAKDMGARASQSFTATESSPTNNFFHHAENTLRSRNKAADKLTSMASKEKGNVAASRAIAGVAAGGAVATTARHNTKEAGVGVGAGMSTSQYSGPLSMGAFKMVSGIPSFNNPEMEARPAKKEAQLVVDSFHAALKDELSKLAGGMNSATDAMHAAGRLHATQSVGAPKTTAPPGPSIAQIAKPKGYGEPIAGAKKNTF